MRVSIDDVVFLEDNTLSGFENFNGGQFRIGDLTLGGFQMDGQIDEVSLILG